MCPDKDSSYDSQIQSIKYKNCQHIVSVCSLLRFYLFFLSLGIFYLKKLVWNALSSQKTFHMYKVHRQVELDKVLLHCLNNSPLANVLFLFCNYYRWTSQNWWFKSHDGRILMTPLCIFRNDLAWIKLLLWEV